MWRGLQVENSRGIILDGTPPWFRGEKKNCKNVIASKVWNCEVHKNYSPWPPPIPKLYKKRSGWRLVETRSTAYKTNTKFPMADPRRLLVSFEYLLESEMICKSNTNTVWVKEVKFEVTWQVSADMTRLAEYLALHCKLQKCTDIIIYTETRILRTLNGLCWDWNTHEQNCK